MNIIRVVSIQRGCVYDGPGIRTTVFLKGCTLHCPWCCNPETISFESDFFYHENRCLRNKNIQSLLCKQCVRNGSDRKVEYCPFEVIEPSFKDYTLEELSLEILKDEELYKESGGGITFSGGEPLLWIEKLYPLLKTLKQRNINIAFETSLYVQEKDLLLTLKYVDIFIIDLKLQKDYPQNKQKYLEIITKHIELITRKGVDLIYRMVFINTMIENTIEIIEYLKLIEIEKIELLLCHNLAAEKYKKIGIHNIDYTAREDLFRKFSEVMKMAGINVNLLSV